MLALLSAAGPATAQGFGWFLDDPPPGYRRARPHRAQLPADEVPLPPPRPRFPGDAGPRDALVPSVAPGPAAGPTTSPAPDAPTKPVGAAPAPVEPPGSEPTPPLPPERPADLGGAPAPEPSIVDKPATPEIGAAPAAPTKPDTPGPPVPATPTPPLPPEKPPSLGGSPAATPAPASPAPAGPAPATPAPAAPAAPAVAPSGASTAYNPREPAADPQCADHLKARGVTAEPVIIGPQPDARCTVVQPMKLMSATLADGSTVLFPDRPVIACITADAFSAFVHDLVAPLAKGTWGVGVIAVSTGPGLECRSRDHVFGAKLSAHGQGLAVDIAQLKLADGRVVAVGEPKTDAERGFETAARAGGCGYFHTVLGPGSDSYHRTHWHFDLEVRGKDGDSKYCK